MRQSSGSLLFGLVQRERFHVSWLMTSSQLSLYETVSDPRAAAGQDPAFQEGVPFPE